MVGQAQFALQGMPSGLLAVQRSLQVGLAGLETSQM